MIRLRFTVSKDTVYLRYSLSTITDLNYKFVIVLFVSLPLRVIVNKNHSSNNGNNINNDYHNVSYNNYKDDVYQQ